MSAATAVGPAAPVVGGRTVAELARAEVRYVLRSPLLWLGTAVYGGTVVLPVFTGQGTSDTTADVYMTHFFTAGALALTAFLVAAWAAQRERPATTAEMFVNTPARRWERTLGLLGAAVVPFVLALVIGVVQMVVIGASGGIVVGDEPWSVRLTPTPLELLGPPLAIACSFVAGVAVVRVVRSRAVTALLGVIGGAFLFLFWWIWTVTPFALFAVLRTPLLWQELGDEPTRAELNGSLTVDAPDQYTPIYFGVERDLGYYGLHLLFVVGLTALLAGIALVRSGPDRRSWRVLLGGFALCVLSIAAQLLLVEGARDWMGTL
jgi:ABC-type transport system involved in multi-copper enzyme maturation permease subunit